LNYLKNKFKTHNKKFEVIHLGDVLEHLIDPINFSELKGIFNRPIKKDTWDHERLWNYLGKPDAAVSKPITRHLYVIGRSLRCGDLATAKRRLEILKTPEFIEQLIVLRGHLMNHYNGREDYEVGI
jgi:hypothetical protein